MNQKTTAICVTSADLVAWEKTTGIVSSGERKGGYKGHHFVYLGHDRDGAPVGHVWLRLKTFFHDYSVSGKTRDLETIWIELESQTMQDLEKMKIPHRVVPDVPAWFR